MPSKFNRAIGTSICFLIVVGVSLRFSVVTHAADPAFVGALSLLTDSEVADQLGLDDAQKAKLEQLLQDRERSVVELVVQARSLERAERDRRQALFVADSERQGIQLLTEDQRQDFERIRLAREGLQALLRPEVADAVQLTDQQKQQIQAFLAARQSELEKVEDERKRRIARTVFDRRIENLLSIQQRRAWEELIRVSSAEEEITATDSDPLVANVASAPLDAESTTMADVDDRLQFNFEYAPWKVVLEWFSEQARLSLVMESPPPGSFNLVEQRRYTPAEALDVINSVLLTKGYTLVRRESMLIVINLEDGIPPNLVTTVPVREIDQRGEFELISTLFQLGKVSPEDAEQEITKLLGPQGTMQVLGTAKQLFVTETAGRLRTIRDVLRAMEDPDSVDGQQVTTYELKNVMPEEAFSVLRQMLGLPEGLNASADGTFRMATDILGQRIMVTGPIGQVEQAGEILKLIDVPMPELAVPGGILASPQLEVYSVSSADPESVLQVLQTLLVEDDVRLAVDPKTNNLIALALPSQQALIRSTLQQMQTGGQSIDVIRLNYVDPQIAVLAINQLFGSGEEGADDVPRVNADVTTGQLLIRGSDAQIAQIRELLGKMGESDEFITKEDRSDSNVRVLPISGSNAEALLKQVQQIWPAVRPNRIRTVVPSAVIRSVRPQGSSDESLRAPVSPSDTPAKPKPKAESGSEKQRGPQGAIENKRIRSGIGRRPSPERLLAQLTLPLDGVTRPSSLGETRDSNGNRADIVVAVGASGLIIASQDLDALDDFEDLLLSLNNGAATENRDFAVFYLRHATAESATEILKQILDGEESSESGDGGLLDGIAGAALEGMGSGGDLMGSLLGLGGGDSSSLTATGSFSIVPDIRLNLLVVQANSSDMQLIEQLLEVIDQRASPEKVQTIPAPRLIPIYHANAEAVAEVVRQVFANQLASGTGQGSQPSPQDFIRALRGGRGNRGSQSTGDERKLTVGVDSRGNHLVVAAPDDLFRQVTELVDQLDQADPESAEMTRVITLNGTNPELVRRALSSIVGSPATSAPADSTQAPASSRTGSPSSTQGRDRSSSETRGGSDIRQQIELFRALRRGGDAARGGRGGGRPSRANAPSGRGGGNSPSGRGNR